MSKSAKQDLEAVSLPTFSWKAGPESVRHLRSIPTISRRLAYVVMETELNSDSASISYDNGAAVVRGQIAHLGVPVRNQINTVDGTGLMRRLSLRCVRPIHSAKC